jgi:peptidoglycan/xylan/chitin deacetylase (PgdA/CDA1 family)
VSPTLAILAYHQIGEPSPGGWHTWYHIPEDTFISHLVYLRDNEWEVIDGAALLKGLEEPATLPARAALLTFDDAYRSVFTVALPRLVEFGYPAVLFAPTQYVGDLNRFDADTDEPEEAICSWDELRELEAAGVSVESHGVSHRSFSELSPAAIDNELARSKAVLERELRKVVKLFAFPYGDVGADPGAVRAALRRCGYNAAHLYHGGATDPTAIDDRFQLPRIPLGVDSDLAVELS